MHSNFHNCQPEVIEMMDIKWSRRQDTFDTLDVLSKRALEEQRSGGHADNSKDHQIHQVE